MRFKIAISMIVKIFAKFLFPYSITVCTTLTPKIKGIPELKYDIYLYCLVSGIQ